MDKTVASVSVSAARVLWGVEAMGGTLSNSDTALHRRLLTVRRFKVINPLGELKKTFQNTLYPYARWCVATTRAVVIGLSLDVSAGAPAG